MTNVTVWYLSKDEIVCVHTLATDAISLLYDDLLAEPLNVRHIMRDGLVIGRVTSTDEITRSGTFIPASRIVQIDFADDYTG